MTHHIVYAERDGLSGWNVNLPGGRGTAAVTFLYQVEDVVRRALQEQYGSSVMEDTIEVRIGGRRLSAPETPAPAGGWPQNTARKHQRARKR
jgi:hypothetical protein